MPPKPASPRDSAIRQSLNQFTLALLLLGAVHIGYSLDHHSDSWLNSLLPLLIDGSILLLILAAILALKLAVLKLRFDRNVVLSNFSSTAIFLLLCYGTVLMLAYSAYTGDRFNPSLIGHLISNAGDLLAPVITEAGYPTLFIFAISAGISGVILHRAHLLNTRHIVLIFLLSTLCVLLARNHAGHMLPKVYAFFSTATNPLLPATEREHQELPPSFRSLYLTMFGWNHAAYRKEEQAGPDTQYDNPVYLGQSGNRPNILLLVLESVRASATSPYNDSPEIRHLTPNLYHLSQAGILVKHAYSTIPHTSKALVGIFCGQFPRREMAITESSPDGLPVACLPNMLSRAGYQTAYFQSAIGTFENRHGLTGNMGFQEIHTQEQLPNQAYSKLSYVGMDDYVMLQPALEWMQRQSKHGKPFFVGLLTVVSHHPYSTPQAKNIFQSYEPLFLDKTFAAYLSAVGYTDRFIGDLIRMMEKAGLMRNTIVIVTGDHGEAFAEHGPVFHNGTPHEEGMKVPLILYSPDLLPPMEIDGLRSHLDIMPTILEFAGIKTAGQLPGKSLVRTSGHESLAGACWYDDHCAVYYKADGEKYIYWHGRKPNEHYRLSQDPGETDNLIHKLTKNEERRLVSSTFSRLNSYESVYRNSTRPSPHSRIASQ